jgi:hypothetical protein
MRYYQRACSYTDKCQEWTRYDNNKRFEINNFKTEMDKYGFVAVCRAFRDDFLSVLFEECKKGDYVEDGSVEIFGGWLWRDMLVLEKETDDDVKVSIDSRPVLSGLLDGLKKGMGWEEKVFCDVALLRTSRCMKPVKLVE